MTTTNNDRTWLSVDAACELAGFPRRTLYDWWATSRGPRRVRLPNGHIRVRADWLEDWLLSLEEAA